MKTIVFDFDGTIADTLPEAVKILNEVLPSFKIRQITDNDVDFFRREGLKRAVKETNVSWPKIILINKKVRVEMKKRIEKLDLIEGIKKVLLKLKEKKYTLGILTGNSRESVKKFLKKNGLEIFDFIYSGSGLFGKHLVIKRMMKTKKFKKNDFVYVGDEVRDIEACKKVGVKIISVAWGFNTYEALKKYEPDWLIRKPNEIIDFLVYNSA